LRKLDANAFARSETLIMQRDTTRMWQIS